ncbi:uncharacterized protein LOC105703159 isoform X3 [Orussus abietinus]|nr:uncharacterized protein LOC105703159 isoform X3 [Orussus abietinus]
MLIVDIRPRRDYELSKLKHYKCINIPAEIIQLGKFADSFNKYLRHDNHLLQLFKERGKRYVNTIVLMDWNTTQSTITPENHLCVLKKIFRFWDRECYDTIVNLDGGFVLVINQYPELVSNPGVQLPVNYDTINKVITPIDQNKLQRLISRVNQKLKSIERWKEKKQTLKDILLKDQDYNEEIGPERYEHISLVTEISTLDGLIKNAKKLCYELKEHINECHKINAMLLPSQDSNNGHKIDSNPVKSFDSITDNDTSETSNEVLLDSRPVQSPDSIDLHMDKIHFDSDKILDKDITGSNSAKPVDSVADTHMDKMHIDSDETLNKGIMKSNSGKPLASVADVHMDKTQINPSFAKPNSGNINAKTDQHLSSLSGVKPFQSSDPKIVNEMTLNMKSFLHLLGHLKAVTRCLQDAEKMKLQSLTTFCEYQNVGDKNKDLQCVQNMRQSIDSLNVKIKEMREKRSEIKEQIESFKRINVLFKSNNVLSPEEKIQKEKLDLSIDVAEQEIITISIQQETLLCKAAERQLIDQSCNKKQEREDSDLNVKSKSLFETQTRSVSQSVLKRPDHNFSAERIKKSKIEREPGITGLKNLGNTCYMNSIIQCLSHTNYLKDYIISNKYLEDLDTSIENETRGRITEELMEVIKKLWSGEENYISPCNLKNIIGQYKPQFEGYEQHDSHEFLTFLLNRLHNDLKRDDGVIDGSMSVADAEMRIAMNNQQSIISQLFFGLLRSTIICVACEHNIVTYEVFNSLTVAIPHPQHCTLDECIEGLLSEQMISDWKCCVCKVTGRAIQKFDFAKLPPIFVIQLNRFTKTENNLVKRSTCVIFPFENFNLRPYLPKDSDEYFVDTSTSNYNYNLYAISNHSGTMRRGHYIAFCKNIFKNQWYRYDDQSVTEIRQNLLISHQKTVYMLFYISQANI